MNVKEIDNYRQRRLQPGGTWSPDVLHCIFYVFESVGPCYSRTDHPTVSWSYIRLVEIGCEYLRDTQNVEELQEFLTRVSQIGIKKLRPSQKKRFLEQLAWLLNISDYKRIVETNITPFGGKMPDTSTVCTSWLEARNEYKRLHPQEILMDLEEHD